MIFFDAEIKDSQIAQMGLFTKEYIKKGSIVGFFMYDSIKIMTEKDYQEEQRKGNSMVIKTACRYVGKYFLYGDSIGYDEHFNHSFTPNILYHCGICFALRDILPGEELTVNYHYLLAEDDVYNFTDIKSGRKVDGISPTKTLVESAKELIKLYESTDLLDK
jgi:SET domain-containing protein